MRLIAHEAARFIVFCDDLSFDKDETSYKSLKTILDGGLEGRPDNVLFYATSNRRHMMPRDMIDNERATAINPGEAIEEKVSLSDRFGLWLGFHNCDQPTYLAMIRGYCDAYGLEIDDEDAARPRHRMVADPRRPLRPRRHPVRPRTSPAKWAARSEAEHRRHLALGVIPAQAEIHKPGPPPSKIHARA